MGKSKSEEYYMDKYPSTGLISGSTLKVEAGVNQVGKELKNGHIVTEADQAEISRIVPKGEKVIMQRQCESTGEPFWLATSDVHQTRFSPAVRETKKKEKARERRKTRSSNLATENEELKARLEELEGKTATA